MTDSIAISPVPRPVRGTIRPPGSKSITNRALVCAALADGQSTLTGALDSEDTQVMVQCLRTLGLHIDNRPATATITIQGENGQVPSDGSELFVANSGTTIRFLTALVALGHGTFRLDGIPRMRERPIGDLIDALEQLGVTADCESTGRCPPVVVQADGLRGGRVRIRGDISSQYLSGLLMAAPLAAADVEIDVVGNLVSRPYIDMTLRVMQSFGVDVHEPRQGFFHVPAPQAYAARAYAIEPDASAASYFWAVAAVTGGDVTVDGLSRESLQGDVRFCEALARMGCQVDYQEDRITVRGGTLCGIDIDMNAISDTVQTLAVVALFAKGPTTIRGVGHIRHKESDRIGDLVRELDRLGGDVTELSDGLRIVPGPLHGAEIETYNDHRMAMSLALAGLKVSGVVVRHPGCVAKTYPGYFEDLATLVGETGTDDR